jgi:mercuric ion binding protein
MKKIIIIFLVMMAGLSMQAQEKKNKNAKQEVTVNGSCEMCKKRIEIAAYSVKGVKSAAWSEETHNLQLILDENKCSLDEVQAAVAKAGYDTETVKANKEDYEKLPGCCQYDRT